MVQLKSTDAMQITVKQKDIRILEEHAAQSHKVPVFAIQFLNTGEVWLMARQKDLATVAAEIGGFPGSLRKPLGPFSDGDGSHSRLEPEKSAVELPGGLQEGDPESSPTKKVAGSTSGAREGFYSEKGNWMEIRRPKNSPTNKSS